MKNIKNLDELRFNVSEDMNNMFIEILLIKEMLENKNNKGKERELLQKQFDKLTKAFVIEFRKNNKKERAIYNDLMNK